MCFWKSHCSTSLDCSVTPMAFPSSKISLGEVRGTSKGRFMLQQPISAAAFRIAVSQLLHQLGGLDHSCYVLRKATSSYADIATNWSGVWPCARCLSPVQSATRRWIRWRRTGKTTPASHLAAVWSCMQTHGFNTLSETCADCGD